jgi:osmoprotectant transport system substrate-binding protein
VEPALEQGLVDLVPEYTGTALTFLDGEVGRATSDRDATYSLLRAAFARRGITTLAPAPASNQNALAVTRATADHLGLRRVSDLVPVAPTLVLGGPPECPHRPFCQAGFETVYGLRFKSFQPLDAGGPLTVGALEANEVDVGVLFTTTPQVDTAGFVLLEDDRALQPAENVVPVARTAVFARYAGRLATVLDPISALLTQDGLRHLNKQVEIDARPPADVVRAWLDLRTSRRSSNADHQAAVAGAGVSAGSRGGAELSQDLFRRQKR